MRRRKAAGMSLWAAIISICLQNIIRAQIDLAPANLGLRLEPQDGYVKAVPGRNPNMPPWFEDLGVKSFGQILGESEMDLLQPNGQASSPMDDMGIAGCEPLSETKRPSDGLQVSEDGLVSGRQAESIVKADDGLFSSDSSSSSDSKSEYGSDSWETISLGNSTENANATVVPLKANSTGPIVRQISGVPYPKEELSKSPRSSRNTLLDNDFVAEKSLLPPADQLAAEQYSPKAKNIPLWKPKPKNDDPPALFILPADNPKRIISTNVNMFRPIVATSTYITKVSGSVVTSTTISTVDQNALRFKSCIYGCPEMTSSDSLVGTTTIITVLPYQIPCSLVSCPPCPACFQSTIKVSVCPTLAKVQAKERTTFVNGPTVTVIRSTVTRTACTATRTISAKPAPPETITETETVTVSATVSIKVRSSSERTSRRSGYDADNDESSDRTPFVDPSLILGGSEEDISYRSSKEAGALLKSAGLPASTVTETILSTATVYETSSKILPSLTVTKTVLSERVVLTVTSTVLPVTAESTGVCSTFIICNPTQFTCPAQVTNLPQIKAVVQAIMEGQEKYGSGGAGTRRLTPNGAYIDDMGPPGLFGDGSKLVGGLNPVNQFGFGPGGMFQKVLGPELIPTRDTESEYLAPTKPASISSTETASAAEAKIRQDSSPQSTTRIVEAMVEPTGTVKRSSIKKVRKQASSAVELKAAPALFAFYVLIVLYFF